MHKALLIAALFAGGCQSRPGGVVMNDGLSDEIAPARSQKQHEANNAPARSPGETGRKPSKGLLFDRGAPADASLIDWPVIGAVSSFFGERDGRPHNGIDIRASRGTAIRAAADGRVAFAGTMSGFGRLVVIRHDGFNTLYAHCDRLNVRRGQHVERGQRIATVGQTGNASGPHLHFEFRSKQNVAMDPMPYFKRGQRLVTRNVSAESNPSL